MKKLEDIPVVVRFFREGSVEDVQAIQPAENLQSAKALVRDRYPFAVFVRCCEHEPDGGCVFVYPNETALDLDERDFCRDNTGSAEYGRWIGLISSAAQDEPGCTRPARDPG